MQPYCEEICFYTGWYFECEGICSPASVKVWRQLSGTPSCPPICLRRGLFCFCCWATYSCSHFTAGVLEFKCESLCLAFWTGSGDSKSVGLHTEYRIHWAIFTALIYLFFNSNVCVILRVWVCVCVYARTHTYVLICVYVSLCGGVHMYVCAYGGQR